MAMACNFKTFSLFISLQITFLIILFYQLKVTALQKKVWCDLWGLSSLSKQQIAEIFSCKQNKNKTAFEEQESMRMLRVYESVLPYLRLPYLSPATCEHHNLIYQLCCCVWSQTRSLLSVFEEDSGMLTDYTNQLLQSMQRVFGAQVLNQNTNMHLCSFTSVWLWTRVVLFAWQRLILGPTFAWLNYWATVEYCFDLHSD